MKTLTWFMVETNRFQPRQLEFNGGGHSGERPDVTTLMNVNSFACRYTKCTSGRMHVWTVFIICECARVFSDAGARAPCR